MALNIYHIIGNNLQSKLFFTCAIVALLVMSAFITSPIIPAYAAVSITEIASLEHDTDFGLDNSLVMVDADTFALAYQGPDGDGFITTFDISADGTTITEIASLEHDNIIGNDNSLTKVDADTFALAYQGPDGDGFITTFDISADGTTITEIASLEHDTDFGLDNSLVMVDADTFALAYQGEDFDGFISTFDLDVTLPVITLLGDNPTSVQINTVYTDAGATASDVVDGVLTGSIVTVNPVDTSTLGAYTVTYDVKDSAGFAATQVTRTVNVVAAPDTGSNSGSGTIGHNPHNQSFQAFLQESKIKKVTCESSKFGKNGESLRVYAIKYDRENDNKVTVNLKTNCGPASVYLVSQFGKSMAGFSSDQPAELDSDNKLKQVSYTGSIDGTLEKITVLVKDKRDSFSKTILLARDMINLTYQHNTGYTSNQTNSVSALSSSGEDLTNQIVFSKNEIPSWIKSDLSQFTGHSGKDRYFFDSVKYLVDHGHI